MAPRMLVAGVVPAVLIVALGQAAAAAAPAPDGAALFRQRCQSCHMIAAGKAGPVGPNLYGVVGRKAAASKVPFNYSEALKKSGLTWTRPNLDKFLSGPAKMVPGTKMVIMVPDAAQRAAVLDYLARAK